MLARICTRCTVVALAVSSVVFVPTDAHAKGVRLVAINGLDANPCQGLKPCRTLQRGIDSAPDGGVVVIVDPGKYGSTVTVDKSITIDATVGGAVIDGIVVNAPGASAVLRGLVVNGTASPVGAGIVINAAASVHILSCIVERFDGPGILVDTAGSDVYITDTAVRNNNGTGLIVLSTSSDTHVVIADSRVENNSDSGIFLQGGATNQATVERLVLAGNGVVGLGIANSTTARISNSVVVNNGVGLQNSASTLLSRQNNTVDGNGTNTQGTITALPPI